MKKEDIFGEVIIGNINDDVLDYLDKKIKEYKPFTVSFSSVDSFLKWLKEAKKPLIRSKWHCSINENLPFNLFYRNYKKLSTLNISFIEISYLVSSKGVYSNLKNIESDRLPIRRSSEIVMESFESLFEDFYGHIDSEEDKGYLYRLIVKRIGYNKRYLELYAPKTLSKGISFSELIKNVKEFFPQLKITPTEEILLTVLKRDKNRMKAYYDACDRYSEKWLNGIFLSLLDICIKYQNKVRKGEIDFGDVRNIEEAHKLIRIIRDISISDLIHLRLLLIERNIAPIETYFGTNPSEKFDTLLNEMNLDKKVVRDYSENWRNY